MAKLNSGHKKTRSEQEAGFGVRVMDPGGRSFGPDQIFRSDQFSSLSFSGSLPWGL